MWHDWHHSLLPVAPLLSLLNIELPQSSSFCSLLLTLPRTPSAHSWPQPWGRSHHEFTSSLESERAILTPDHYTVWSLGQLQDASRFPQTQHITNLLFCPSSFLLFSISVNLHHYQTHCTNQKPSNHPLQSLSSPHPIFLHAEWILSSKELQPLPPPSLQLPYYKLSSSLTQIIAVVT